MTINKKIYLFGKPLTLILAAVLKIGIFIGLIVWFIYYVLYVSIPDKVKAEVGGQLAGPLQTLGSVEAKTNRITSIEDKQTAMNEKLIALDIKFDLYFVDKRLDKKTAEAMVERGINRVTNTQDPIEQTAALKFTNDVLSKTINNHVPFDYKKTNQLGLVLLEHNYKGKEYSVFKDALGNLASQRVLKFPEPKIPQDSQQKIRYITTPEQVLDGTSFEDVTFINCKIIYDRGWIGLKNVRFINCTFDVVPEDKGKEFFELMFKSDEPIPSITLQTPEPLSTTPKG